MFISGSQSSEVHLLIVQYKYAKSCAEDQMLQDLIAPSLPPPHTHTHIYTLTHIHYIHSHIHTHSLFLSHAHKYTPTSLYLSLSVLFLTRSGEILVAGNNVTQHGYYKLPKETAKSFIKHSDGKIWFHSGDIGVMEEDGVLKIVDRKKDLIKLQGGEYVSLGKVEANLKQVPAIGACCVFAQSDKTFCVVIVSQPEKGWKSVGGRPIEADLVAEIAIKMKEVGLKRFEVPTKVAVDDTIWTPESGLVTVSMKLQRNALREFYNLSGGHLDKMGYRFH